MTPRERLAASAIFAVVLVWFCFLYPTEFAGSWAAWVVFVPGAALILFVAVTAVIDWRDRRPR